MTRQFTPSAPVPPRGNAEPAERPHPSRSVGALSALLLDALDECARYHARGNIYWFRIASMRKLAALGLVEQYTPRYMVRLNRTRPYRPTDAGLAYLKERV